MNSNQLFTVVHEGLGILLNAVIPLFLVTVVAFGAAVLQTALAVREESVQYSIRVVVCCGVIALFGASFLLAVQQLMERAIQ